MERVHHKTIVTPNLGDIATLPQQMIMEILLRLPVKSLMRCKCVSKEWYFLISSSEFVNAHLNISSKNNAYIHDKLIFGSKTIPSDLYTCSLQSVVEGSLTHSEIDESFPLDRVRFDCPFVDPGSSFLLVDSCNGLICVLFQAQTIVLWNPTTRQSKMLPDPDLDSCSDCFAYGFGYDKVHDDYKVVELISVRDEMSVYDVSDTLVKVYSLRTNSWKILSDKPSGDIDTYDDFGLFLHGAIHWSGYNDLDTWAIFSYDLATDTFDEFSLPDLDGDIYMEVEVLGGCLAVFCHYDLYMDVLVMQEYGKIESWSTVLHIPFFGDISDHDYGLSVVKPRPLFLLGNGKVLMNYGSRLSIYDSSDPQPHQYCTSFMFDAITYMESLVSPNMDEGKLTSITS